MPRSPSDATRFTATGPYVATKPQSSTSFNSNPNSSFGAGSSAGSHLDVASSAPYGETPQQKIARLRAAAAAARRGKESRFDQVVRVGRIWADRAHRVTAMSIIGFTVVSGAVATAGITDMMLHNRRRRNEWLAERQAETARQVAEARRAEAAGSATEDQMLLINRERAAEAAAEAKRNRPGVLKRATGWLFSGLSSEEQKGGRLGAASAAAIAKASEGGVSSESDVPAQHHDTSILQAVGDQVEANRRQGERFEEALRPLGGPLDRQAGLVTDALSDTRKRWTRWITGS